MSDPGPHSPPVAFWLETPNHTSGHLNLRRVSPQSVELTGWRGPIDPQDATLVVQINGEAIRQPVRLTGMLSPTEIGIEIKEPDHA